MSDDERFPTSRSAPSRSRFVRRPARTLLLRQAAAHQRRRRPAHPRIAEWRAWLHSASNAKGGFRDVVLPSCALERVLGTSGSSGSSAEAGVGAALALRDLASKTEAANVQKRIRIAAEASADPKVHLVLEAAAADVIDEDALAVTLRRTMETP